jgi:hypothetical protein
MGTLRKGKLELATDQSAGGPPPFHFHFFPPATATPPLPISLYLYLSPLSPLIYSSSITDICLSDYGSSRGGADHP